MQKRIKNILSSVMVYFIPDAGSYWDKFTPCNITKSPKHLGEYYLDFTSKAQYPEKFDVNGIPLFNGRHQPVVICQYALGLFSILYKSRGSDDELKSKFLNQVNWLVSNSLKVNGCLTWLIDTKVEGYGLFKPFSSAIAQGEAISVLLRAFLITGDKKYFQCAEEALNIFEMDVCNGGIRNTFNGFEVYEEYPSDKTNFVLNGFIFALFGLYDFTLFNNLKARELFSKGIKTLENTLAYFNKNYWSQYNLYYYPNTYLSSYKYHIIHIEQLKALSILTNCELFRYYSRKWNNYQKNFFIKTYALTSKIIKMQVVKE